MNPDLLQLRRRRLEQHRKKEEARRQRRLAQAAEEAQRQNEDVEAEQPAMKLSDDTNHRQKQPPAAAAAAAAAAPAPRAELAPLLPPQEAFFGERPLPRDVGLPHMKTSPSSSVSISLSQSPAKQPPPLPPPPAQLPQPRRKRPLFLGGDDSSSEEEDIVALAGHAAAAAKAKEESSGGEALDEEPPPMKEVAAKKPGRSNSFMESDDDDDDVDLVALAKPAAARSKTKKRSDSLDDEPTAKAAVAKKPTRRRKNNNSFMESDDSDGDDDSDGWVKDLRRREQEAKRKKKKSRDCWDTSDSDGDDEEENARSNPKPPARNPLALMKEQEAPLLLPARRRSDMNKSPQLWSDSEPEAPPTPPSSKKKKKKTKKAIALEGVNEGKKKKKRTDQNNNRRDFQVQQYRGVAISDVSEEDEGELENELKPFFEEPRFPNEDPPEPLKLGAVDGNEYEVPMSISRYLPKYQQEGIRFLFKKAFVEKRGAILGDDMGLGKTVQTISLLAAMFKKTGTGLDLLHLNRRKKSIHAKVANFESEKLKALNEGRVPSQNHVGAPSDYPSFAPVLIISPCSVMTNWVEDFKTWGHFSVAVFQGKGREAALESIENGLAEVLVCGDSVFNNNENFNKLRELSFRAIIVDEFHKAKNVNSKMAKGIRIWRDEFGCPIIGLTGTVMSNHHKELWSLLDCVVDGYLGPWPEFSVDFARPIALGRVKDADEFAVETADTKSIEFSKKLYELFLKRDKADVLADSLPKKDERIVFCETSNLQKELYRYILELPDFKLIRECNGPCDCGVNQKFFLEYKHLRSREEQIEYMRRHKKDLVIQGKCCHRFPFLEDGSGEIDPRAVLWRDAHDEDGGTCGRDEHSPHCINFHALHVLYKISSHPSLLQLKLPPESYGKNTKQRENTEKLLRRVKVLIPEHLLPQLPGGYFRNSSVMDDHFNLSGKMRSLDKLLRAISRQQGRVLLFSYSVQMLDIIESYVMAKGCFSYLRMDGTTPNDRRKELADQYRADPSIFMFLLTTKAMGLGLNLTAANFVIIFDVDWNPSTDSQAQDRAYRIGQDKDVTVFRLVSRGTVEELMYLRQVYKMQMASETIVDVNDSERKKSKRIFHGVVDDKERRGELFGMANLLKFKDGTFLNYDSKHAESRKYGVGVHATENLEEQVNGMEEEEFEQIGQDPEDDMFENLAKCIETAEEKNVEMDYESDEDSDLGGESQAIMNICERVEVPEEGPEMDGSGEQVQQEKYDPFPDDVASGKPTAVDDFYAMDTQSAEPNQVVKPENPSNDQTFEQDEKSPALNPVKKEAPSLFKDSSSTKEIKDPNASESPLPAAKAYEAMETQSQPSMRNLGSLLAEKGSQNVQQAEDDFSALIEKPSEALIPLANSSQALATTALLNKEKIATSDNSQEASTAATKSSPRNTMDAGKTTDTVNLPSNCLQPVVAATLNGKRITSDNRQDASTKARTSSPRNAEEAAKTMDTLDSPATSLQSGVATTSNQKRIISESRQEVFTEATKSSPLNALEAAKAMDTMDSSAESPQAGVATTTEAKKTYPTLEAAKTIDTVNSPIASLQAGVATSSNEKSITSSDNGNRQKASTEAKKSSPLNTLVVGKTTDTIRRGEAGGTTFSAFDLPLPGGNRKKKRKNRYSS